MKGLLNITENIDGKYINIFVYSPLSGTTYIDLPEELKNSMKGLINIKNNDNKCFLWSHIKQKSSKNYKCR